MCSVAVLNPYPKLMVTGMGWTNPRCDVTAFRGQRGVAKLIHNSHFDRNAEDSGNVA